ncbi:MAG: hypothetical protein V4598_04295 [Bdellovibrionota bacterium]
MKNLIFILALSVSAPLYAETIPGQAMLEYFGATCPSQGEWTQAALNDSRSLYAVIDAIKNDPDCKTMGGALTQLSTLNDQVTQLAEMSESKKQIAAYDAQERSLLIEISKSTNPIDIDNLNLNLRAVQVGRAGLLGRENAGKELSGPNTVLALSRAVQLADSAFSQIAMNQRCQEKSPGLLTTATGMVSSIGAAVTAVNPAIGLGLQAGSVFMGTAIEQYRQGRFNILIRQASQGTTAYQGYKCALETMTNRWCDMTDAKSFLRYKMNLPARTSLSDELRDAIKLNDREVPVILDWLLKVKSGVAPQTTADGDRQSMASWRLAKLESLEAGGISKINSTRKEYAEVESNFPERWSVLRTLLNSIAPRANSMSDEGIKNPFTDVYPAGYIPYFLIGLKETDPTIYSEQQGGWIALDNWKNPNGVKPTLEDIRKNYVELVRLARIKVEREMNEARRPDAPFTLADSYIPDPKHKISPMKAIGKVIEFLENSPPTDTHFNKIYNGTLQKLKKIYDATENAVLTDSLSIGASVEEEALRIILEEAQLTYGTIVLQSRLELLIRIAVMDILENSPPEEQIIVAQLLASDRFMETLSRFTGKNDPAFIVEDIDRAMKITSDNLNAFVSVFGRELNKQLKKLSDEERNSQPTMAALHRNDRAQLCYLLLGSEKTAKFVDVRFCEGLKLGPYTPGAPETKPIVRTDYSKDIGERGCILQDYRRSRKIFSEANLKALSVRRNLK